MDIDEEKVTELITSSIVNEGELTPHQKEEIEKLAKKCFGDVPEQEVEEDFIAQNFARILAYYKDKLVGHVRLIKREIEFDGKEILLGGEGAVCVAEDMRGLGIASKVVEEGLEELRRHGCDVACLAVDLEKEAFKLYEKLGFKFMDRDFSFENIRGEIKHDNGLMLKPLNSEQIYEEIMQSDNTLHLGKGYW